MKQKVTMQLIADELQLSKSLVSKALSNQAGVSEDTKERVRLTAMRLGYRINSSITSIASSQTGNIAVLVPREDLKDFEYWGKIVRGIEKELSEKQFSMILAGINTAISTAEGLPSCITDRKVDGALILGLVPLGYILAVQATGIPIVLVDSLHFQLKLDHVLAENFLGGYEAARYLLERKHRKIGFVGDENYASSFAERLRGFIAAMKDYRLESGNEAVEFLITADRGNSFIPFSAEQLKNTLMKDIRPTALVCGNDPVAYEVLQAMGEYGLSCPQDISLIGFDNLQKCEWTQPSLTSIDACKETMGTRAVQLMFRRMNDLELRPEHVMIITQVFERDSVEIFNETANSNVVYTNI